MSDRDDWLNKARMNAEMISAGRDTVVYSTLTREDMMRLATDIIIALDEATAPTGPEAGYFAKRMADYKVLGVI